MVKSANAKAGNGNGNGNGNQKISDFFQRPASASARRQTSIKRKTRAQGDETQSSPLTGDGPGLSTSSTSQLTSQTRSTRRSERVTESFATLLPSSSLDQIPRSLTDSPLTTVSEMDMKSPVAKSDPLSLSPTIRRSTRKSIPPPPPTVSPLTSPTKKQAPTTRSPLTRRHTKPITPAPHPSARRAVKHMLSPPPEFLPNGRSTPKPANKRRKVTASLSDQDGAIPTSRSEEKELILPDSIRMRGRQRNGASVKPSSSSSVRDGGPATGVGNHDSRASSPLSELSSVPGGPANGIGNHDSRASSPLSEPPMIEADTTWNTQASILEVEGQLSLLEVPRTLPREASIFASDDEFQIPRVSTPPPSSPAPSSPVMLDAKAKAAQMIAKIKARAFKAVVPSDDEDRPRGNVPRELSSDSSDEDMNIFASSPKKANGKGKSSIPSSAKRRDIMSPSTTTYTTARYTLRDRRKSGSIQSASTSASLRAGFSRSPETQRSAGPRPRTKAADPLARMLREKKASERRGFDADGLMDNDPTMAHASSASVVDSGDGNDADDESMDESYKGQTRFGTAASTSELPPSRLRTPERELELNEGLQLLGSGNQKAIGMILDEDIASRRKGLDQAHLGVAFWQRTEEFKPSDDHSPANVLPRLLFGLPEVGSAASVFADAVNSGDNARVLMLLDINWLHQMKDNELSAMFPWCAKTILSTDSPSKIVEALLLILQFDLAKRKFMSSSLFQVILVGLVELRPIRSVLVALDCHVSSPLSSLHDSVLEGSLRHDITRHLTRFLTVCAQLSVIIPEDVPGLLMLVVLVGMDPSTAADNVRAIRTTIENLGKLVVGVEQEAIIAQRLALWVSGLDLANQAHFFTVFTGSVPSSITRVARWIAYRLLVGSNPEYSILPPLQSLEDVLRAPDGIFCINKDTDFEPFYYRVKLATASLAGIEDYVEDERRLIKGGTSKLKNQSASHILSIQDVLDKLHGRIQDTRAADLVRSRTKADLLRLSMRLIHQRNALLSSGEGAGKPRKLTEWLNDPSEI